MRFFALALCLAMAGCSAVGDGADGHATDSEHGKGKLAGWPEPIRQKLASVEQDFVRVDINMFGCELIEEYTHSPQNDTSTTELAKIDSETCQRLFADAKERHDELCGGFLYSVQRPVNGYYPITVLRDIGADEQPVIMVLFDHAGKVANTLEVADLFANDGGCLSSSFVNDSTLIREFNWRSPRHDSVSGYPATELRHLAQQITILSNGELEVRDIAQWSKTVVDSTEARSRY